MNDCGWWTRCCLLSQLTWSRSSSLILGSLSKLTSCARTSSGGLSRSQLSVWPWLTGTPSVDLKTWAGWASWISNVLAGRSGFDGNGSNGWRTETMARLSYSLWEGWSCSVPRLHFHLHSQWHKGFLLEWPVAQRLLPKDLAPDLFILCSRKNVAVVTQSNPRDGCQASSASSLPCN